MAAARKNFLVYKSSAGSGKTYTLVKEYLKIVLKEPSQFRSLLAVTFTNKAAAEMKERVLLALKQLSDTKTFANTLTVTSLLPELSAELGILEDVLVKNATKTLENILHHYADFSISTIDSFMQQVIRSFAFDLHIPINYNVHLETQEIIQEAIANLLEDLGENQELTKLLLDFSAEKMENDKSWDIERDLQQEAAILTDEEAVDAMKSIQTLSLSQFIAADKKMQAYLAKQNHFLRETGSHVVELISSSHIPISSFYQGNKGFVGQFSKLASGDFSKVEPSSYTSKTLTEDKWFSGSVSAADKQQIQQLQPKIMAVANPYLAWMREEYPKYKLMKLIRKSFTSFAVLKEIDEKVQEIKREEQLLLISDSNRLISSITLNEPVPFIYERLGVKYKHFLIDEFQDTSLLQWQNMLPLFDNSLSTNNCNLVVGDGKQAIYRFRNGEVEQFAKLPEIYKRPKNFFFEEREDALKRNYQACVLDTNYRSKAEIVKFNNRLFAVLKELLPDSLKHIYQDHEQKFVGNEDEGYVNISFLEFDKEHPYKEVTSLKLLNTVRDLLEQGFDYEDIAVLCRNNTQASELAALLLENDYPVVSQESLLLSYSSSVHLVISCLRYLADRENSIQKISVLAALKRSKKISDEQFHATLSDARSDFDLSLLLSKFGFDFKDTRLLKSSLYDMVENLLKIFGLHEVEDAYIQYFLDFVFEFMMKSNSDLQEFLKTWDEKKHKLSILLPEGMDAIRVQTIHKAKGLQYKVVIYPFADEKVKQTIDKFWIQPEIPELQEINSLLISNSTDLEATDYAFLRTNEQEKSLLDLMNVFYVATTRPIERLYIFSKYDEKQLLEKACVTGMLAHFLQHENRWEKDKLSYDFGEKRKGSDER